MTYTLILVASMLALDYHGGSSTAVDHIPGFATYQECVDAGNEIPAPPSNRDTKGSAKFICVKVVK